jgi:PAS domain S-box-containing protein
VTHEDQGGEAACSAGVFGDPAAEPSDRTLAQLLRDLGDAVVICDRDGAIVFWNRAATTLFGWSALEAGSKTLDLPERFWSRHAAGYARAMETGHTDYGNRLLEVPAVHRDGHIVSIAFTVTLLFEGGQRQPTGVAAVIRDDTANREARRAVRGSAVGT